MGKSVINNDPFAFKPEYNQQVSGAKVVAPPNSKLGENDPFAYRPEYNADVKKKVGGTESEIGITDPAPTQSELQSKKENATNFLITDINQNDFFSKLAGQTDQYFSHTTPQRVNEQAAAVTQNEVFRNPASLQRYTDQRIKDLNEELTNIQREKNKLHEDFTIVTDSGEITSRRITDQKRYNELTQQAIEKEQYKKQLKNNVAEVAADQILSQMDLSGAIDVGPIGRKISSIADPEQEAIFKMAEKGGKTLPGIRREQMNYTGLQAIKSYLSRNPDIPNYDQVVKNVNDLESDFDERNPQTTALRVKEKIGAQLYKEGKSSFFGFGYSPNTLKEAADNPETALTNSERKIFNEVVLPTERRLVGTDIPTSGFTRSFYNAIEKGGIGMGKTLGDVTGLRDEADQAADVLTQEQAGARYRPAGESPTAQGQLAYLSAKEKTGKLTVTEQQQKKELENYTYVRNGWSKFKDGVGDLTGQVAMIALATKGLGAAGEAFIASGAEGGLLGGMTRSAIGQALSNETVGLFTTSYLNAYDNYKQQAIQLMPGEDKAANRTAYATVMSSVEALSERIFPDTKILTAFTKGVAPTIKDITTKFITREITQQVAREEMQKALTAGLKTFGKEYLKSTGQEATEEAVVDIAQGIADSTFGGQPFDIVKTGQQALNTFLTTALYSPLVAGMAGRGAMRQQSSQNTFMKSAITDMAANPAQYLQSVEDLQLDGTITQQQANEKIQLIKSANQYLQEIPISRTVTTKTGEGKEVQQLDQNKPFDYPETSSYLLHRLNEGILTEQIGNTTDEVLKAKLQKDLKRSQEIRKGLFDGTIGVTPDLKEVIDNDEKADELGIFNTKQVQPDELLGTPFEQQNKIDEKKSEIKNAEATTTEGQSEAAKTEISQTPQITTTQEKEATDFANELLTEDVIPAGYKDMVKNNPIEFWQFVAQQAQNVDANWQSLNETDAPISEQAANDAFGETVVNYAKELFPIQSKINKDEGQKQEAIPASEEGDSEEIPVQATTEGNESKGDEVLTEQGAEPIAEAPLELTEEEIQKPLEVTRAKKVSGTLRGFAAKIQKADITGAGGTSAQSDITKIPREVMAFAINRVADAIDAGEAVVNAIQKGVDYIREQGHTMEDDSFKSYTTDLIAGKKPRVRITVEPKIQKEDTQEENKEPEQSKEEIKTQGDFEKDLKKELGLEGLNEGALPKLRDTNSEANKRDIKEDKSQYTSESIIQKARSFYKNDPHINRVLKFLEPLIQKNKNIQIDTSFNWRDESYKGRSITNAALGYSFPSGEIILNFDRIRNYDTLYRVAIHELIHSVTSNEIRTNEKFRNELVKHLKEIRKELNVPNGVSLLKELVDRNAISTKDYLNIYAASLQSGGINENTYQALINKGINISAIDHNLYGTVNELEMIAELFSNQNFYNALKEIQYKETNLLKKIISTIIGLFSGVKKDEIDNIADYLMDLTESVVKGIKGTDEGGALPSLKGQNTIDDKIKNVITRVGPSISNEQLFDSVKKITGLDDQHINNLIEEVRGKNTSEQNQEKKEGERATPSTENIDDYEMTTSGEINRFLSGNTWEDLFGEKAEGDQNYLTQKLSDMLQDGKNMIAIAQQKWGGDVMMYAKPLFQLIQGMSNDKAISNKKAVLLATLLGELQEAKKRSPERFDAISQIEKAVFSYYQNYMNVRGKEIVAGRLLRLYRDKYIGDIYADMILEKEQVKAKKAIQQIEQSKQIDDQIASEEIKPITEEEKKKEDNAAKKKSDTAKKEQSKKKKMTSDEAKRRADDKVKEIEEKMGKDGRGGLINRIKEAINKLNCK